MGKAAFFRPVVPLLLALAICAPADAFCAGVRQPEAGQWASGAAQAAPTPSAIYTGSPSLPPGAVTVQDHVAVSDDLDDYDDVPTASVPDPLEGWNRFWFRFNDIFFMHVAEPVYRGWKYVTPQFFRTGLSNLYHNILFPQRFINCLLQGRPLAAGVEFSRFMMNVMGSAGLVDLASSQKTVVPVDPSGEDFGQTLARWGVGPGCYLVWPFWGPSTVRDTFGLIGDAAASPITYVDPMLLSWGIKAGLNFNDLNDILPAYENLKSIAVDPYIAMREAYMSLRRAQAAR